MTVEPGTQAIAIVREPRVFRLPGCERGQDAIVFREVDRDTVERRAARAVPLMFLRTFNDSLED